MSERENQPILSVRGLGKEYAGVEVLGDIDLDFYPSEIHALVGENGAGKSTISKIISGVIPPTRGTMTKNGQAYRPGDTREAIAAGISIVHQEFNLIPVLSVAQNIFLGREQAKGIFLSEHDSNQRAAELLELVDLKVSPKKTVRYLSVAQQQLVEIAKCLSYKSELIIMDEPTAALTLGETKQLFHLLEQLRAKGVCIVYISHKLEEIFQVSQRVTVLRDGRLVGTYPTESLDQPGLVSLMVGREISSLYQHMPHCTEETVLEAEHVSGAGFVQDVSFTLKRGEILGFGGLMGAGRTELMKLLFGEYAAESGSVTLFGERLPAISIKAMVRRGMAYLPESRKEEGILSAMKVQHNISLTILGRLLRGGFIQNGAERELCSHMVELLQIKTHGLSARVGQLSGGNQQKVVLAKWLATKPRILILDEPTRGIDIGAKHEIYKLMNQLCQQGLSILMISSEMPELIGMCDRVYVMAEGRITGELRGNQIEETAILAAAVHRERP